MAGVERQEPPLLARRLTLDGRAGGIGAARDLAREFLRDLGGRLGRPVPDRLPQAVELVVSELVTNAHRHASGPCLLDLIYRQGAVEVAVWDTSSELPWTSGRDPKRIGGHGMEIVTALCETVETERRTGGKRVRAVLR